MIPRVAIAPSNQHLNEYAGLPTVTEEKWAAAVCAWVQRRLNERGAAAGVFHVPGTGSKSTDELTQMLDQAIAWGPQYMLSVHSDAVGDAKQTGILMLMARETDRSKGMLLGRAIAAAVGLPYKATWVYGVEARKINYLAALRTHNLPGCLVEVGEHATVAEAAWNWRHIKEIGLGIADALADYLGLAPTQEDDMPIDIIHDPQKIHDAQERLIAAGLLDRAHAGDDAASVGLLMLMCARLLERMGDGVDLKEYELRLVKREVGP